MDKKPQKRPAADRKHFPYIRKKLLSWAGLHMRTFPWRKTRDPYKVCVVEILLQQTFVRKVVPVYKELTHKYPGTASLSKARALDLKRIIRPLGLLYRAKTLVSMAKHIEKLHAGKFPKDKTALLNIPGVGQYTAAAILSFSYGFDEPVIDVNVIRFYHRYFGLAGDLPRHIPDKDIVYIAGSVLPKGNSRTFNYALLDFSSTVCSHYKPLCSTCIFRRKCSSFA